MSEPKRAEQRPRAFCRDHPVYVKHRVSTVASADLVGAAEFVQAVNLGALEACLADHARGITTMIEGLADVRPVAFTLQVKQSFCFRRRPDIFQKTSL